MEEGCKNHKETLYSSKGKIVYVVGKPRNIYRLRGNPIVFLGFTLQSVNITGFPLWFLQPSSIDIAGKIYGNPANPWNFLQCRSSTKKLVHLGFRYTDMEVCAWFPFVCVVISQAYCCKWLRYRPVELCRCTLGKVKVIYLKYSKHWPYAVAFTIDFGCSKMLNHGLNHGLFLSLFKLIPCHIHWIVYALATASLRSCEYSFYNE